MSTALARVAEQPSGALTMYDRISDPISFMTQVGEVFFRTAVAGVKSQQEGQLLALVCLMENKSPFEINREFHLMDGKLAMRADAMLARFRMLGGKHMWLKDGSDGIEAELQLMLDGTATVVRFSMAEAKAAGYVRKGSNWEKNPGNMLRARCSSNGVRMVAPEVISGYYTPEEMEDETGTPSPAPAKASKPKTEPAPAAVTTTVATTTATPVVAEPVTEAVFEPAAEVTTATTVAKSEPVATTATTSAAEVAATAASDSAAKELILAVEARDNLVKFLASAGIAPEALESQLRGANPKFVSLDSLSAAACNGLLNNLRAQLKK